METAQLLELFSGLKERDGRRRHLLIGEGRFLAERIIDSSLELVGIVALPEAAESLRERVKGRCPVVSRDKQALEAVTGFPFHRGILIAARRPQPAEIPVICRGLPEGPVLVLPRLTDPENLGSLFRSAAAFGVGALFLGPGCCDPWSRRVLRVSMGAVLEQPFYCFTDEAALLDSLDASGYQLIAAADSPGALPLPQWRPQARTALFIGHEGFGLSAGILERCHHRLAIPVSSCVDSLNAGVAAGILLYTLSQADSAGDGPGVQGQK